MEKTKIVVKRKTREIEVSLPRTSPFIIEEVVELVSLACNYNANFNYDTERFLFTATCNSARDLERLSNDYKEYFYQKLIKRVW